MKGIMETQIKIMSIFNRVFQNMRAYSFLNLSQTRLFGNLKNTSMKLTKTLFRAILPLFVLIFSWAAPISAQDSCSYRLRIFDSFGDGWAGSQVFIRSGNGPEVGYAHDGVAINRADSIRTYFIRVRTGDTLIIRYESAGVDQNEIRYTLFNNADEVIFNDGVPALPTIGVVFRGRARCKNCGVPINFRVNEVRTNNATARWSDARGFRPVYHLQWDTVGFTPGTARNRFFTSDTFAILTNLNELTRYEAYVQAVCSAGDSSSRVGPAQFFTDTATDVAVTRIVSPAFGRCDLNVDTIKFLLGNAGGVPQQLIKFGGSVNGQNLPISFPADGLFTGVLSRDSTTLVAVRTLYDFSAPGRYVIRIWSEVPGDRNRRNDTATLTIMRPRIVGTYPYYQTFEAGDDTWFPYDTVGNTTWELGRPNGAVLKGAFSGNNAWTTWKDSTYKNNDFSYLLSPCFNMTSLTADPRVSFRMAVNSQAASDGTWLEQSVDNGATWTVVGGRALNAGVNWYNDSIAAVSRATWGGTVDSVRVWRYSQNILRGAAGRNNVRLRFVFRTSAATVNDGVAIDDIMIAPTATQDLAIQNTLSVSSSICGSDVQNRVTVRFSNVGTLLQQSYTLNYQVGTQAVVTETPNLSISPNQSLNYTFTTPFATTTAGNYSVRAWIASATDAVRTNDTVSTNIRVTLERPLLITAFPYTQGFETGSGTWSPTDTLGGTSTWGRVTPTNQVINGAANGQFAFKVGSEGLYNNNERSYLYSPCFNFSSFTTDPRINFSLNIHSESGYDGAWLEGSEDGGVSWRRIGGRGTGINWYNDTLRSGVPTTNRYGWTGTTTVGWRTAQHVLTGYAGKTNCRFRFVFTADGSINTTSGLPYGGFAIDNVLIGSQVTTDLANPVNSRLTTAICGSPTDSVGIIITNLGSTAQSAFVASYRFDNQAVVNENVTLTPALAVGASRVYVFNAKFNSTANGAHTIRTWVRQASDTTYINDTATSSFFVPSAIANFASYNFNDGIPPQYWTAVGDVFVGIGSHGNPATNGLLYANLYDTEQEAIIETYRFGPVRNNRDSVSFDYRMVNEASPFAAYNMSNNDTLYFEVATGCNEDWTALASFNRSNHVVSTNYVNRKYGLGAYVGRDVRFRWRVVSDVATFVGFFFDLDNVNFITCPESFGVQASVRNTRSGQSIGSVALRPTVGLAPFTYAWSNGRTTDSIGGLAAGSYLVTITDARGCTQTVTYNVVNTVGFNDPAGLFNKVALMPNPTSGTATLDIEFAHPVDARIQVLNIVGQPLSEIKVQGISQQRFDLDISDKPAGVYLVRILAENRSYVARLVKQ
jgi:hypothetical protein